MQIWIRLILFLVLLLWNAIVFFDWTILINEKAFLIQPFLKQACSTVCHQDPNKIISDGIRETLVCSRCAGIYLGTLLSSIILLFFNNIKAPPLKVFIMFAFPMLLDVILYSIGIYSYSKIIAFITGLLLGSMAFLYFYDGFKKLIQREN